MGLWLRGTPNMVKMPAKSRKFRDTLRHMVQYMGHDSLHHSRWNRWVVDPLASLDRSFVICYIAITIYSYPKFRSKDRIPRQTDNTVMWIFMVFHDASCTWSWHNWCQIQLFHDHFWNLGIIEISRTGLALSTWFCVCLLPGKFNIKYFYVFHTYLHCFVVYCISPFQYHVDIHYRKLKDTCVTSETA